MVTNIHRKRDREMAEKKKPGRKADPSLKTEKGYYESQKTASKKWSSVTAEGNEDKANRKITLRMTEAKREEIQAYMKAMHDKEPDNPKYALNTKGQGAGTPNMNSFIMALIDEEMARNPVE